MSLIDTVGRSPTDAYPKGKTMSNQRNTSLHCWALALTVVFGLASWANACCAETGAANAAIEPGVDTSIAPGDDFFAYANGAWLKSAQIPDDKPRWGVRNELDLTMRIKIDRLVEEAAHQPEGSDARKMADFHAAFLNQAEIEARGLKPLQPLLEHIARIQDKAALARFLGSELRVDVDPLNWGVFSSPNLFGLSVEQGVHGENRYFAYLLQGGLGLPSRAAYLATSAQAQETRGKYQALLETLLSATEHIHRPAIKNAMTQRAEAVIALETALAYSHKMPEEEPDDSHNADNKWTLADLKQKAPGFDWKLFFGSAGLAKQPVIIVWHPDAIIQSANHLATQPLAVWKDYLRVHALLRNADVLPEEIAGPVIALTQTTQVTRTQRALDVTNQAMPDALGRLYVEKNFPPGDKKRVQTIVANVIAAFDKRIDALDWMTPTSKLQAKAKLKALYFGVGYPEKWETYEGLSVHADDAYGNMQNLANWNKRNALARLGQAVDMSEWLLAAHTVGAASIPNQNAYNFAAGLLQAPKFDPAASDATNYGAIGAMAGHEISHFVDLLGAENDAQGRIVHWWTPADHEQFKTASLPLVKQYAAYQPFPDLALDGQKTLSENIADLGGLNAAFDAYRLSLGDKAANKEYVLKRDREFFIGFARSWRGLMRDEAMRKLVAEDAHAPERYRIATVRNMDAWYAAFDVQPGQKLYLEPKDRVRVW